MHNPSKRIFFTIICFLLFIFTGNSQGRNSDKEIYLKNNNVSYSLYRPDFIAYVPDEDGYYMTEEGWPIEGNIYAINKRHKTLQGKYNIDWPIGDSDVCKNIRNWIVDKLNSHWDNATGKSINLGLVNNGDINDILKQRFDNMVQFKPLFDEYTFVGNVINNEIVCFSYTPNIMSEEGMERMRNEKYLGFDGWFRISDGKQLTQDMLDYSVLLPFITKYMEEELSYFYEGWVKDELNALAAKGPGSPDVERICFTEKGLKMTISLQNKSGLPKSFWGGTIIELPYSEIESLLSDEIKTFIPSKFSEKQSDSISDQNITKKEFKPDENGIYKEVDIVAEFPGGNNALLKWISNNLRYPETAQQNDIQGKVVAEFIVETSGKITYPRIIESVDKDLDREVLRLISKMPLWSPAQVNGIPVRSYNKCPINFKLQTQENDVKKKPEIRQQPEVDEQLQLYLKAKDGDIDAMIELGTSAMSEQLYKGAVNWFKQADKKKDPRAKHQLAIIYIEGLGEKQNIKKGIKMLKELAESDFPEAQATLGRYYYTGLDKSLPKDDIMALELFKRASILGNETAMENLNELLPGLDEDNRIEALKILAKMGHKEDAAIQLAGVYFNQNKKEALEILQEFSSPSAEQIKNFISLSIAAEQGDGEAMAALADLYDEGAETFIITPDLSVGPDSSKREKWLLSAKSKGYDRAGLMLKDIYLSRGVVDKAFDLMKDLSAKGDSDGMVALGSIYFNHYKDYPKAFENFSKAVKLGNKNIRLSTNHYGDAIISMIVEVSESAGGNTGKMHAIFDKTTGKSLTPDHASYKDYVYAMEKNGDFMIDLNPGFIEKINQYEEVYPYSEGVAKVKRNGKWGFINTFGEEVIPCNLDYEDVGSFSCGLAMVRNQEKTGYINMKCEEVIPLTVRGWNCGSFTDDIVFIDEGYDDEFASFSILDNRGNKILSGKYNPYIGGDGGFPAPIASDGKIYIPDDYGQITVYDRNGKKLETSCDMDDYWKWQDSESEDVIYKIEYKENRVRSGYPEWTTMGVNKRYSNEEIIPAAYDDLVNQLEKYGVAHVMLYEYSGVVGYYDEAHSWWSENMNRYYGFVDKNGKHTFSDEIVKKCNASKEYASKYLHDHEY